MNESPHSAETAAATDFAEKLYTEGILSTRQGRRQLETLMAYEPDFSLEWACQQMAFRAALAEEGDLLSAYAAICPRLARDLAQARAAGVKAMKDRHVDGLVMMGSTFVETSERGNHYLRQAASTMPVVLLNGHYPCENVYCVLCDDRRATAEAAQFLLDGGRKRILYLYHSRNSSGKHKLQGYLDALESRGLSPDERLMRYYSEDKMSVVQVRDFLLELDAEGLRFDAVLTSEDLLGVGAVKYARAKGLSVPGDLSIVGYNNSHLCLCSEPELTSVDNKLQALCAHCVATMLGALQGRVMPQLTVFAADLVRRGSTLG